MNACSFVLFHHSPSAISSTVGQMFLYYTIKKFGPIILTMIMTSRQMFSMIISYIRYVQWDLWCMSACAF